MTLQQKRAKELWDDGKSYAAIRSALNVESPRWVRRLLQAAGIKRRVGRPRSRRSSTTPGRRISYAATGLV